MAIDLPSPDEGAPKVLTVVSCGEKKQDLDDGETVPARELYTSGMHTCKDRVGRHSHGYYIMSAKFGLVHHATELPEYDKTLANMTDGAVQQWASEVAGSINRTVEREGFDAVVLIGAKDYVQPLQDHFEGIPADVLTPWQTNDEVRGSGLAKSWCTEEDRWPVNIESIEEIGEVVSSGPSTTVKPS